MSLKSLSVLGAAGVLCIALPALAQTPAAPHHRIHHARVMKLSNAELVQTRDLNRQQLEVAQPGVAGRPNEVAHNPGVMQEPISRPMYQRVPGGNPLYSAAAAGSSAHVSGPPPAPH